MGDNSGTEWVHPEDNWKAIWDKHRAYRETHPDGDAWDPEATIGRRSAEERAARKRADEKEWREDFRILYPLGHPSDSRRR
jgi:hypothetical protein